MDDVRRVHVVAARQHLEHEVLQVVVCEVLARVDDTVHVSLHQLRDDVDVLVVGGGGRLRHIEYLDDVLVVKEFQQADLTDDTLSINQIFEGLWYFFDGNLAVVHVVVGRAHDTVGAVADLLDVLEFLVHAESRAYFELKEDIKDCFRESAATDILAVADILGSDLKI